MIAKRRKKKGRSRINLSSAIRDYLKDHPDAKPAEIVGHLQENNGVHVDAQYVSKIKSNLRAKLSDEPTLRLLQLAKEFCREAGGVEQALKAIRDYAALMD